MPRRSDPAWNYVAVTPHDTTNFPDGPCRALYVGGAGNVVAITLAGVAITFVGVQAGAILPIVAKRVNSTLTTATSIVALY